MTKRKFAAFDIDGTIARSALFFQIVDELIAAGHLPAEARVELDEKYERYRRREHQGAFYDYSEASVSILVNNMTKVRVTDYQRAVDAVVTRSGSYIYTYTRDLIRSLKKQGYFLIALSGSEMYSVQQFAKAYNFDVAIGEVYHEKDGYFTGQVDMVVHKKDVHLKRLITKHDLTLKGSIAVGDTKGDIQMLEVVEHPIAFNPEQMLYQTAKQNGWKIVVERKNVIYELLASDGTYQLQS